MAILPSIQGPGDIRALPERDVFALAEEIRKAIIETVAKTGGHLGSSLGVVEITLALHRLLESPREPIVWDTGHQAYPHKLVTGRYERFGTLRQLGGVGGFPRRSESKHDVFDGGHAGTGLSIAAGLATARDIRHGMERIAVVVGDAALMSGLSLEALNDIGHRKTQLLIVLNDNEMSISQSVGALSKYLSEIKLSNAWKQSRSAYDRAVERIPIVGPTALELSRRARKSVVSFAQPGQLFEDLGITYIGVVPGHDVRALEHTFGSALDHGGPVLVHVRTQKGRGYHPAERDQVGFHGAALPPMADTYEARRTRAASPLGAGEISAVATGPGPGRPNGDAVAPAASPAPKVPNYTHFFAQEVLAAAREDPPDRGDHGRHADRHRTQQVPGRVPGPVRRRRDRGAARGRAGDRDRDGGRPADRRHLRHVPPAGVRPDRPRRLPERPAGAPRRRPSGARRGGRDEPPGDVLASRPTARSRTWSSRRRRTSRSCARWCGRRSPRTTRSP